MPLGFIALTMALISQPADRVKVHQIPLQSVRLLPGPFLTAQEANGRYLMQLEPDRLLSGFRQNAGLEPKGERYGGWESMGIAGHSLGHYLTALSYQFAATGDRKFHSRITYIVKELAECQDARDDGYIGAIPDGDKLWSEIRRGDIRSQGFDLNGCWVPWYTEHKVFAGLIDAYQVAYVQEALPVLNKFGDWAVDVTKNLTHDQWQVMLRCEHGGMNEAMANVADITGDSKYLELSRKFYHEAVLTPLTEQQDKLAGLHSNTQIPKLIGLAKLYELEGKPEDRTACEFFWDRIVNHRSFAIGGNSNREHLGPADRLSEQLSPQSAETCNTYNMLKLTRHLDSWQPSASWYDFYERALFNHILGSQRHSDGMLAYFMPLQPQATRPYSTPTDSFWCCVGTGMENHARYGEAIYSHSGEELRVNLFIPSVLTDQEAGSVRLECDIPASDQLRLTIQSVPRSGWKLAIRKPWWLKSEPTFTVNKNRTPAELGPDGYYRLSHTWKDGDVVTWRYRMEITTEPLPDDPKEVALLYGPVVLAGIHTDSTEQPAPAIIDGRWHPRKWLRREPGPGLKFRSRVLQPAELELIPFSETAETKYTVYFRRMLAADWYKNAAAFRREQQRRAAEERATTDIFHPGEMQPERDHDFQGEHTETGDNMGRKWRHAVDGWFEFRMKVDPAATHELVCDYWSADAGRVFDILVDGKKVAEQHNPPAPANGEFIQVRYPIQAELTHGKTSATIRLQAHKGSIAGGLYGARMVTK